MPTNSKRTRSPTIADVLAKLIDRDDEHHDAWTHVTAKLSDHGRLLESMVVEQQRFGRLMEQQATYNERLVRLAETQNSHSETFARAFGEIERLRNDFNHYLEKHDTMHALEKAKREEVTESVTMFKGAIRNTYLIGGAVVVLSVALLSTWRTALETDISRLRVEVSQASALVQSLRLEVAAQKRNEQ